MVYCCGCDVVGCFEVVCEGVLVVVVGVCGNFGDGYGGGF